MPGKIGVKIKAGRNLPIMDKSSDTTDAFVEIKLGNVTHKTDVCRKSLNPTWNTDWYRFEVDDAELQDEPLQIRLMDYDTYSANDAIGKVNISLNPLCLENAGQATHGKGSVLSGWMPVFDTMHGIRGEINIIVKVDLFSDVNKFRQSSCGIPFFHSPCVPFSYRAQVIHGFVEELVVNDDPEYQWIDKIRTPRASNEARQVVFLKLSGQVQRKMGLKAINMGANAVIGYSQCFDLEGDVGVVARGVGTAVTLIKDTTCSSLPTSSDVALIEDVTQKYLDFLTCAGGMPRIGRCTPSCRLNIRRTHTAAAAAMYYLESTSSENEDADIMLNLIRQEDERGEKSRKKLRDRMRRLTHSSRSIFSEKYATLLRRIEPKIPEHATHSLGSIIAGSFGSSNSDNRSRSSRPTRASLLNKPLHAIVRSISEDTAVKRHNQSGVHNLDSNVSLGEYQDNTRSAPDITEQRICRSGGDIDLQRQYGSMRKSSSTASSSLTSSTDSLSLTDDSIGPNLFNDDETADTAAEKHNESGSEEDNDVDDDEVLQIQWIKPGETRSCEISQTHLEPKRHTLLQDLRTFSKRIQQLIHLPLKKSSVGKSMHGTNPPPKAWLRLGLTSQRKSYYSSQPEIPTADTLATTLNTDDRNIKCSYDAFMRRTVSLNNLSSDLITSNKDDDYNDDDDINKQGGSTLPIPPTRLLLNQPVLLICPSTPTPTDSDKSPFSPLPPSPLTTSSVAYFIDTNQKVACAPTPQQQQQQQPLPPPSNIPLSDPPLQLTQQSTNPSSSCNFDIDFSDEHVVNILNTNHSNNNNQSSMLAPCFSVSSSAIPKRQLRSTSELPAPVVNYNNANVSGSPSMKRLASPVSNHLKLSPSPSKSGISGLTTNAAASDSASTSTTSTATTMIPKEVGEICRRSSDSDLSVTPKGNSICVASERLVAATAMMRLTQPMISAAKNTAADSLDMLEYPFLTMTKYPTGFILHLGATVAARSVKLLERVPNPDEPEVRDSWWTELRMEIRSHARSLGCNVVLGYTEATTISDDVCVLSATGTAAVINMVFNRSVSQTDIFAMSKAPLTTTTTTGGMSGSIEERDNGSSSAGGEANHKDSIGSSGNTGNSGKRYGMPPLNAPRNTCAICHIPYNLSSVPFNVKMRRCAICRKGRVPDVMLATLELPEYMQVTGRGCFMQAQVVRAKKDLRSELNAKEISDGLPFLEYELHRVLINKLKAKGMNAIFGLRTQVAIGERMIALIATGTALFLTALPVPQVPKIVAGNSWTDKQKLNELQKKLQETYERNQEIYQLKSLDPDLCSMNVDKQSDTDDSDDEEMNEIDLNCGNKELCVLEVDDIEDLEIISLLMEPYPPEGFHVVNTQQVPGMMEMETVKNLQMFTQVWRARLDVGTSVNGFPKHFQRLLQTIYFKLRTMIPCAICDLRFRLDLPDTDQIQLLVTGMALGLTDATKIKYRRKVATNQNGFGDGIVSPPLQTISQSEPELNGGTGNQTKGKRMLQEEDYIFPLDEDQMVDTPTPTSNHPPFGMSSFKVRKTSPSRVNIKSGTTLTAAPPRTRYFPLRDRYGVDITPLSFIPGGRIEKYLGNLNFFFIRESTSIRENGGISGFVHGFITEMLAVVRANISALGGNAMVSYYKTELILFDNQHKNQGQCLLSIGGDAVYVSYFTDD